MERFYMGVRYGDRPNLVISTDGGENKPLNPRLDLWNHSPAGFEWGYGGSGPAQLALALLADALGNDSLAIRLHQSFKFEVIAGWHHEIWACHPEFIRKWALGACEELLADVVDLRESDTEGGQANG